MSEPENLIGVREARYRRSWRAGVAGLIGAAAAAAAIAQPGTGPQTMTEAAKTAYLRLHMIDTSQWTPILLSRPSSGEGTDAGASPAGGAIFTVPYWSTTVTSPVDGKTYDVSMVGGSPYATEPQNTTVTYVPVAVKIHLGALIVDPTAVSHCDTKSPADRFFASPLFTPAVFDSNGVDVSAGVPGGTQLISAFQRANFWSVVKGTNFGVTLVPSRKAPIVVDWFPKGANDSIGGVADNCGGVTPLAMIDYKEFQTLLQDLAKTYALPNLLPISLAVDTVLYFGVPNQCCALGFHDAFGANGGIQLFVDATYFDTNMIKFKSGEGSVDFPDITIWSHELGEVIDDPFAQKIGGAPGGMANDATPAWGHTGQTVGCQSNLEVGDPLTPAQIGMFPTYPVFAPDGFVYHYQDLAFIGWFYRVVGLSTGGKGSFHGLLADGGQPKVCGIKLAG